MYMSDKNTYYFSHDLSAHQDEKIIDLRMAHGFEGYGIYWMLIELLGGSKDYTMEFNTRRLAYAHSISEDLLSDIITGYGLFEVDGDHFYSKSLISRMSRLDEMKNRRREAGRKGGLAKAKASNAKAMLEQSQSIALANPSKGKERKGEEKKGEEIKVEKTIDGDEDDPFNFEGIRLHKEAEERKNGFTL